jgi:hypothetical protein
MKWKRAEIRMTNMLKCKNILKYSSHKKFRKAYVKENEQVILWIYAHYSY